MLLYWDFKGIQNAYDRMNIHWSKKLMNEYLRMVLCSNITNKTFSNDEITINM